MKHSVGKLMALCGLTAMLVVYMAGITAISSHAADNGIYIATATPHYRNPQTGVIEDSGGDGSQVLGQSMTESATYKKALVEVDSTGNTYITVRLIMYAIISTQRNIASDSCPCAAIYALLSDDETAP